jgi:hypothetical protein
MDLIGSKDPSLYGRLWAASLGLVDLVDIQKKISRMEEILGEEDDMQPITYKEMREIFALETMSANCSHLMIDIMREREIVDEMIRLHSAPASVWNRARRRYEDVDMFDVFMDPCDEWDVFSDDSFSDDDGDTSCTESTDEPLTLRDGSVRDISVADSMSEAGDGKSTEEPDDEVASQQL